MNYETKENLRGSIAILIGIIMFVIACWLTSCRPATHKEYKTFDNCSYDSLQFNSIQEELDFCKSANDLKYNLLEHSFNCIDIIDNVMDSLRDNGDEFKYSINDIEDILIENGYYEEIIKLDSIIQNECL